MRKITNSYGSTEVQHWDPKTEKLINKDVETSHKEHQQRDFDKGSIEDRFKLASDNPSFINQLTTEELAEAMNKLAVCSGAMYTRNGHAYEDVLENVLEHTPDLRAKLHEIQSQELRHGPKAGIHSRTQLSIVRSTKAGSHTTYTVRAQSQMSTTHWYNGHMKFFRTFHDVGGFTEITISRKE